MRFAQVILWFVRLYGEIIHELELVDYHRYRRTNHTIKFLLHQHAFALVHCEIFYVKHFDITKRCNNVCSAYP